MALLNLGTVEAWSQGGSVGERHLQGGADLARKIGRPYLEMACLAQLGSAKLPSFSSARKRCEEAIALAEQHGWVPRRSWPRRAAARSGPAAL